MFYTLHISVIRFYNLFAMTTSSTADKLRMDGMLEDTFLIIGLFVGTIVTLSLYMLSNSVLSVAAVPVIPQSLGNYNNARKYTLGSQRE